VIDVTRRASYKLSLTFDAASLKADLERVLASDWVEHFNRAYYQGAWKGLALRSTTGRANQIYTAAHENVEAVETPVLARCAYFRQVLATFDCPIHTARLLSLGPGSKILEHTDDFLGGEYGLLRVHIPITTDSAVEFYVNGQKLEEGMLNRVSAVVRAYDPCLSCSTHAGGVVPLRIELLGPDGVKLDELTNG